MPNITAGVRWSDNTETLKRNLTDGLDTISRSVSQVKSDLKDATQTLKDFEKAANEFSSRGVVVPPQIATELEKQRAAVSALKDELAGLKQSSKDSSDAMKGVGDGAKQAGDGIKQAADAADKAQANLQQMATAFSTLGREMTAAITLPIVGAATAATAFAADFETEMTRVRTLAGASKEEVDAMGQAILDLAPKVGIGPAELAKGLFVIESAGFKGADGLNVLTTAAQMAALGMGKTDEISRALVGTMLAYTNQNLSAAQAGDILVKTVQLGNMKIDELVPALARVNPIAAAMGIKFQDVTAAMATFTHMGASSAVAATGLRAALSNILTDSAKTEKGFQQLRTLLDDDSISMANFKKAIKDEGLGPALIDLMTKANSAGEAGTDALNKIFPNIRALTEVLAIAGPQAENYTRITNEMNQATGTLADGMKATKETIAQQWNELVAQAQVLAIEIGQDLLPQLKILIDDVLKPGVQHIASWVQAFESLPTPIKAFVEIILGLGAAGGPVLMALGAVARAITSIQLLLFGANAINATSVVGILAKLGKLGGLGEAIGGMGSFELLQAAGTVAAVGGSVVAAAPAGYAAYRSISGVQFNGNPNVGGIVTRPKPTDINLPGDIALEPPVGFVPGGVVDITDQATATKSVLDLVKQLTQAQRDDILSKHAQGEATKDIAKETGIAANVIATFLKQTQNAAKGSRQAAKDLEAAWKITEQSILDSEKAGEQGAKAVAKGLGGGQDLLKQMGETMGDITLPGVVGPTASGKDLYSPETGVLGKNLEHQLNQVATLMPALSPQAQKQIADALLPPGHTPFSESLFSNLTTTLNDVPRIIENAFTGGGGLGGAVQAIGADVGAGLGRSLVGAIPGSMTSLLGQGLGGVMDTLLPGIGGALGSLLGKGLSAIFNIGGPSKQELAGRSTEADFEKQMGGWQGIQKALLDTGMAADQVNAHIQALWAAEKQGPAAVQAQVDSINKILSDYQAQQKAVQDGVDGITTAWNQAGTYIPKAQQQAIANLLKMNGLTDAQRASLQSLLDSAKPNYTQLTDLASKYGITLEGLGPKFEQGKLEEDAGQIYQDFETLVDAGADVGGVLSGMSDSINKLVQNSLQFGTAIPDNMKPLIQNLIDAGKLTDADGNKITDISKINFEQSPLNTGLDKLNQAIDHFADVLNGINGKTVNATVNTNYTTSGTPPDQTAAPLSPDAGRLPGPPGNETGPIGVATGGIVTALGVQRFAMGDRVRELAWHYFDVGGPAGVMPVAYRPIGTDTVPAMLTPGEMVLNAMQQESLGRLLAAGASTASDLVKAGSPAPPVVLQEKFAFDFSGMNVLDGADLTTVVEKKLMPLITTEIEDRRRGYGRRIARALQGQTT